MNVASITVFSHHCLVVVRHIVPFMNEFKAIAVRVLHKTMTFDYTRIFDKPFLFG